MTNYLTLIEFVPGTKAKAQEVNANFSALKDALNTKALIEGDSTQNFSVANATLNSHAITKSQLDTKSLENETKINNLINRFCIKSGNITLGESDLLANSGTTLSFKIGGSFPSAEWTSANGTQEIISTLADITGLSTDGTYSVIKELGVTNSFVTSSKVTQGKVYPTSPADGDYHCLTDLGLSTHKYVSGAWIEKQYINLGTVTVAGNIITSVSTTPYFQNGYDINISNIIIDYAAGINLTLAAHSVEYSYTIPTSGIISVALFVGFANGTTAGYLKINDITMGSGFYDGYIGTLNGSWPVQKGDVIKYASNYGAGINTSAKFFPTKGGI